MSKYIVLDVVFHASSLNYDQGSGNFQELKKITKWDGRQYSLVSRYALRYSILHWANKMFPGTWKLAGEEELGKDKDKDVIQPKKEKFTEKKKDVLFLKKEILTYPEFDLFGFMITERNGAALTRTAPVKISHAVSLTPFSFDSHFTANLDIAKRAKQPKSINPVNMEEHRTFYCYNITIDLDRLGKLDQIDEISYDVSKKSELVKEFLETIFSLKREIKGRMEDLSPWLVMAGFYSDGKYDSYMDRLELSKSHIYKVITKERELPPDGEGRVVREVENETIEKESPKFIIDLGSQKVKLLSREQILKKAENFAKGDGTAGLFVFKRDFVETDPKFESTN